MHSIVGTPCSALLEKYRSTSPHTPLMCWLEQWIISLCSLSSNYISTPNALFSNTLFLVLLSLRTHSTTTTERYVEREPRCSIIKYSKMYFFFILQWKIKKNKITIKFKVKLMVRGAANRGVCGAHGAMGGCGRWSKSMKNPSESPNGDRQAELEAYSLQPVEDGCWGFVP